MDDERGMLFRIASHPVTMGTVAAVIIGLAGTLLLSLVFYATPLSAAYLQPTANILYLVGAFAGGFVGAKKAGRMGILFGIETGICYFAFFVFLILLAAPGVLGALAFILKALYAVISAAVGGIFGIALAE